MGVFLKQQIAPGETLTTEKGGTAPTAPLFLLELRVGIRPPTAKVSVGDGPVRSGDAEALRRNDRISIFIRASVEVS